MMSTSCSAHGLGQVLRDGVAQRLLAGRRDADAGLEDAPRRLAGAEAGQADLAGDLLERGVDVAVELGLVDLDGQLDLVALLEGLERALHREASVPAAPSVGPVLPGRGSSARRAPVVASGTHGGRHADLEAARARQAARRPARPAHRRQGALHRRARRACPTGTEGKVILANGFNWLRYRVLFANGARSATSTAARSSRSAAPPSGSTSAPRRPRHDSLAVTCLARSDSLRLEQWGDIASPSARGAIQNVM